MFEPEELMARIVDLEAQLKVSEMAPPAAEQLIACLEGEIAKRDEELAACRVAVENCEVFRARIAELEQDLAYFPSTVRSLAEMVTECEAEINQLRAELSALKEQEPVLPCELDLESSFSCAEKEASLHAGVRDTFYFALIECLQKNKLYRAPAQKELSVVMPERKKAHNCEGIEFWKANGWNDCLDELASLYAAPVSEAKAQGVVMPERETELFNAAYGAAVESGWESVKCMARQIWDAARLNAAPVQQVSVPDDDELSDLSSSACQMALANGVGEESFMVLARTVRDRCAMLTAPAAPAADAGHVFYGMDGNHP